MGDGLGGGGQCGKKLNQKHRVQGWVRIKRKTTLSSPRALMMSALFVASSYSGGMEAQSPDLQVVLSGSKVQPSVCKACYGAIMLPCCQRPGSEFLPAHLSLCPSISQQSA